MTQILNERYANSNTFKNNYIELLTTVNRQLVANSKTIVKYNAGAIAGISSALVFGLLLVIITTLVIIKRRKEKRSKLFIKIGEIIWINFSKKELIDCN